jgi:hypothetical protein
MRSTSTDTLSQFYKDGIYFIYIYQKSALSALVFSQFGCIDLDMPNQRPSVELDVDLDTAFSTSEGEKIFGSTKHKLDLPPGDDGDSHRHDKQGCLNRRPTVKFTVRTTARVRVYPADAILPANGFYSPRGRSLASAQTHSGPPLPSHALPSPTDVVCSPCRQAVSTRTRTFKEKKMFFFFFFWVVVAGLKRENKIRFSVFNPQDPRAPWPSQTKPRQEEGFFGLVPLVTHPSSIPLLGGLTPKFLSLSLHSL